MNEKDTSPAKSQGRLSQSIADWLAARDATSTSKA
jgi:hypothetical protein